jgi:HPt (histidine-containing phosphotransfer) domain-containing protein
MKVPGLVGTAILSGRQMGLVIDLPGLFEQTFGKEKEMDIKAPVSAKTGVIEEEIYDNEDDSKIEPAKTETTAPADTEAPQSDIEKLDIEQPDSQFLNEIEVMLSRLNQDLFTLEKKRDTETADAIFRLVHSIKGNLTMCGAEEPASITHNVETILERARRGTLELNEDAFDVLFDGASYLEQVVDSLLKKQKPPATPDKLLDGLEKFRQEEKVDQVAAMELDNAQIVLDPTGEFYLSSRRRDGAILYQCRIEFNPGNQPHFLVAYLILQRIQRIADVLGTCPAMATIEAGLCEGGIVVLFAPREEKPDLLETLSDNLKKYYGVEHFEATTYA